MEGGNLLRADVAAFLGHNGLKVFVLNVIFFVLVSCASLPVEEPPVRTGPPSQVKNTPMCQSESCEAISKLIQQVRNETVDPCDNFYEYACGQWIKNNPVPKGHLQFSRITQLSKNNERIMKESLAADRPDDTETLMKVKNFYRSCLNVQQIDQLGNEPLLNYIDSLGSWSLNRDWSSKQWDFYNVLANVQKNYPVEVFFSVNVIQDPVKKTGSTERKYVILIDQATLNLPQIIYFTSPKILREVWKYMSIITSLAGVRRKESKQAMKDLLLFEGKLALYWVPKVSKKYVRIPIGKLADALPEFPWLEHLQKVLSNPDLSRNDTVVVLANDYLQNMLDLLRKTDKK